MPKITTFLTFEKGAEEAARYYVDTFPNSKITGEMRYGEGGPGELGSVMTVAFELDGRAFVALNGGPHFKFTDAVSLAVACESQEEVDHYHDRLSDGGEVIQCGWVRDRFGFYWQVTPTILPKLLGDPDPARARRVMEAMLQMKKILIADLQAAYDAE